MPLKRLRVPSISAFHVSDKLMKRLRAVSNAVICLKDLSRAVSIGFSLGGEPVESSQPTSFHTAEAVSVQ
ncbi:hypothetical protein HanXRQr2_Chr12g0550221 [Helianthus annuus]|uniref:Uncharacterized protein n=1 Tax=Helianthus annuus TaxID=4232 RepID=A0A9K3MWV1_HELAN|nr:hypothetical protein HanXRQr2_Chr12g0550221 [Helianthus annuus]KAJ0863417.1 hypothetical protein HanPSC8_Chr12g0529761 [Helianthus annuus]